MKNYYLYLKVYLLAVALMTTACAPLTKSSIQTSPTLTDWKVVDLTQPLTVDMPIWPGDPKFEVTPWATYEKDQYFINRISIGEHSGTHWGTPNTFIQGARSSEMFAAHELVVPAVVIDIRNISDGDVNYRLTIDDVKTWEKKNGKKIASGSVVILFTGWQDKWDDQNAFIGIDEKDVLHWPGFGADTVQFMIAERGVVGLGTDTHGADPGNDQEFGASFAMYDADGMILECLTGLDQLPPSGATLVIGGWPIKGGSGSPARVLAFVPPIQ